LIALLKKNKKELSRKAVDTETFGDFQQRVAVLQGSARVVAFAIMSNTAVMLFKLIAWIYTGSAVMLSEAVHSLVDVLNQGLLAFGIAQSIRKPDKSHPYGFSRARYVYSLISGVGIFILGAGVTVYHGIMSLLHPPLLVSLPAAFAVLAGSFLVEGATLLSAVRQVQISAKDSNVSFKEYVLRGRDPSAVAVLVEDSAAVSGVLIAGASLYMTHYTGNPIYDAIGSISIGGLLGIVALFLIQRNTNALVGQSIPPAKMKKLIELLEGDKVVRSVHDIKATDLGADSVRFKAEINFDGREVARLHINRLDMEALLKEIQGFSTAAELEKFLLDHGEQAIDVLGSEVDRIELIIKKHHPEMRHIDLEIL
jgi:zinc transporter 9